MIIKDLGYFERNALILKIAKVILQKQGWNVETVSFDTDNPRILSTISIAEAVLTEIEEST